MKLQLMYPKNNSKIVKSAAQFQHSSQESMACEKGTWNSELMHTLLQGSVLHSWSGIQILDGSRHPFKTDKCIPLSWLTRNICYFSGKIPFWVKTRFVMNY